MKKLLFVLPVAAIGFLLSCNGKSGSMSDTAKKNLDAHHAISKMFETQDWSKIGDYIANDAVDHAGAQGDVVGLDNIKSELSQMAKMATNIKTEIVKEFADEDWVMSWGKESGTLTVDDPMMGKKAGDSYTMSFLHVGKFKDGKAVEHWAFMDIADMMKMMPKPQTTMPVDTTKMK